MVNGKKLIELLEKSFQAGYASAIEDFKKRNGETKPPLEEIEEQTINLIKMGDGIRGTGITMKNIMKRWMIENWGKKCKDYEKECPVCKAWECFEYIFKWVNE